MWDSFDKPSYPTCNDGGKSKCGIAWFVTHSAVAAATKTTANKRQQQQQQYMYSVKVIPFMYVGSVQVSGSVAQWSCCLGCCAVVSTL